MQKAEIVRRVKNSLRISSSREDIMLEVSEQVDECEEDLKRVGVVVNYDDPLFLKACKCYAKAYFGYEEKSEKFENSYKEIRRELASRGPYAKNS